MPSLIQGRSCHSYASDGWTVDGAIARPAKVLHMARQSRRVRFVYELLVEEPFTQFRGEPTMEPTAIPGFTVSVQWDMPTHTAHTSVSLASDPVDGSGSEGLPKSVPLLTAEPRQAFSSLAEAQRALETSLSAWALRSDVIGGVKIGFELRSVFAARVEGEDWEEVNWGASGSGSWEVFTPLDEVPPPPDLWAAVPTALVDQLREQ